MRIMSWCNCFPQSVEVDDRKRDNFCCFFFGDSFDISRPSSCSYICYCCCLIQGNKTSEALDVDENLKFNSLSIEDDKNKPGEILKEKESSTGSAIYSAAIKSPHGLKYYHIESFHPSEKFSIGDNIHHWLNDLYQSSKWSSWIVYNDQVERLGLKNAKHGHCKGILAWNADEISWLVHSVPDFPREFTGSTISDIGSSEQVYGQSFCYIRIAKTDCTLNAVIHQLYAMDPHVYIEHNAPSLLGEKHLHDSTEFLEFTLIDGIYHVAKSPKNHSDIYQLYLVKRFGGPCMVETWLRGHEIEESPDVLHIELIQGPAGDFKESQDHSKWAISSISTSPRWVYIGDLNRMTSQFTRGGGGFIIVDDRNLWEAFHSIILK